MGAVLSGWSELGDLWSNVYIGCTVSLDTYTHTHTHNPARAREYSTNKGTSGLRVVYVAYRIWSELYRIMCEILYFTHTERERGVVDRPLLYHVIRVNGYK